MKSNDFDRIASIYDKFARLIFGASIVESQQFFLHKIPDGALVLILGGGSGWILEKLFEINASVKVCYIDASENMISTAKKRFHDDNRIQFLCGTENDIPDKAFDAVITNFYLDLFDEQKLKGVVQKIKRSLTPSALWLATDFVSRRWWHQLMLKVMYTFFRITAKIEASKLPDWKSAVMLVGGEKTDSKFFYGDFIETSVFQF